MRRGPGAAQEQQRPRVGSSRRRSSDLECSDDVITESITDLGGAHREQGTVTRTAGGEQDVVERVRQLPEEPAEGREAGRAEVGRPGVPAAARWRTGATRVSDCKLSFGRIGKLAVCTPALTMT
jgi:hypothetical protein